MHRLSLIVVLILAAAVAFAQTSSSGSTPAAPPSGSSVTATSPTGTDTGTSAGTNANTPAPATTSAAPQPAQPGTALPPAPGTTSTTTNPAPVTSNTTVNTTGVVGTGNAAPGAVSPEIHFETVMPAPGATSNMPGAPAGATSSPTTPGTISAPTTFSVGVQKNALQPQANPNAEEAPAAYLDLSGKSFAGATTTAQPADNRSLAEIAAQYKRGRVTQAGKVFTNEDIARLNARSDVNVMGAQDNAALPQGEEAAPADEQQPQGPPKGKKHSPFAPKLPK